ncbi:MAG TPA: hypothetical protein ENK52_00465 [Saprospiraceae bacterium]|nr:hypothetical protein [Saprospiraceae bacterium]
MNLVILTSKKGTKVVVASNLHYALKLPVHKYNANVKKWLSDYYGFKDDVRQPIKMRDFAERKFELSKHKDYYISVELAKLITLNSDSEVKQKYAKWLWSFENKEDHAELLTRDQITAVLEITKVMGLISCQQSVERQHLLQYEKQKGYSYEWWEYRAKLLGYSVEELKEKMYEVGKNFRGKNIRQMLLKVDKYEVIRMAVIDLFIALGKPGAYAKNMGDLAKYFAQELKIEIWDDRDSSINFSENKINMKLVQEVKNFRKGGFLSLW